MLRDRDTFSLLAIRRAETAVLESGKADRTPCWVCGQAVRYGRSAAVYRLIDAVDGGDPANESNLVVVHKECAPPRNSRRW